MLFSNSFITLHMKALVLGATGATGRDLVDQLLRNGSFSEVHIFVRRKVENQHHKLNVHIVDFDAIEEWKHLVHGDVAFSCLGTTLKAAGSKEAQWKVDYDYQYEFAKVAKFAGVRCYLLVSSISANPNSGIFYLKMKGQLEEKVKKLDFESCFIFQPGPLERPNTDRMAELMSIKVIKFFNKIGLFKSQKPVPTSVLAKSMISHALSSAPGQHEITINDIYPAKEQSI